MLDRREGNKVNQVETFGQKGLPGVGVGCFLAGRSGRGLRQIGVLD